MSWTITWGEHTFTDNDLTVGDIAAAQALTGDGWRSADPTAGPNHCANLITIVLGRLSGQGAAAHVEEVAAAPALDLVNALQVDAQRRPRAGAARKRQADKDT